MKKLPDNQIAFYQAPDGSVNIEVLFAEENMWLTQKKMAELFDTTPQNITQHLKNIYFDKEIDESATCKDFLQVQSEGVRAVKRETASMRFCTTPGTSVTRSRNPWRLGNTRHTEKCRTKIIFPTLIAR